MARIKLRFAGQVDPSRQISRRPLERGAAATKLQFAAGISKGLTAAGKSIERLERRNGSMIALKKSAELTTLAENTFIEAESGSFADEENLKIKVQGPGAKGTGETFTNHVSNSFKKSANKLLEGVTNPFARQQIQADIINEIARLTVRSGRHEVSRVRELKRTIIGETALAYSRTLEKNPDRFAELNNQLLAQIEISGLGGVETRKFGNRLSNGLAITTAESAIKNDPEATLRTLETGKTGKPTFDEDGNFGGFTQARDVEWIKHLSGDQIAALKSSAETELKQQLRAEQSRVLGQVKSHMSSILDTGFGIPGFEDTVVRAFRNNPQKIEAFQREQSATLKFYTTHKEMQGIEISGLGDFARKFKPKSGSKTFSLDKSVHAMVLKEARRQLELAKNDPAQLVVSQNESDFENMALGGATPVDIANKRKSLQEAKGVPAHRQRILTNSEAQAFTESLNNRKPSQLISEIQRIVLLYDGVAKGEQGLSQDVLSELIRSAKMDPFVKVVAGSFLESGGGRSVAFDLVRSENTKEAIKKSMDLETLKSIKGEVQDASNAWREVFTKNSDPKVNSAAEIIDAMNVLARYYVDRQDLDHDDAAEKAFKKVLGDTMADPGFLGDPFVHEAVVVPRIIDGQAGNVDAVEDQLDLLKEAVNLKFVSKEIGIAGVITKAIFPATIITDTAIGEGLAKVFLPAPFEGNTDAFTVFANQISLRKTFGDPSTQITDEGFKDIVSAALEDAYFQNSADGKSVMMMTRGTDNDKPLLNDKGEIVTIKLSEINTPVERAGADSIESLPIAP